MCECLLGFFLTAEYKKLADDVVEHGDEDRGDEDLGYPVIHGEHINSKRHYQNIEDPSGKSGGRKAKKLLENPGVAAAENKTAVQGVCKAYSGYPSAGVYQEILKHQLRVKKQLQQEAGCPGKQGGKYPYYKIHNNLTVFDQ